MTCQPGGKFEHYLQMLHDLPAGISEWAIYPARGTKELRTINLSWRVRAADYFSIPMNAVKPLKKKASKSFLTKFCNQPGNAEKGKHNARTRFLFFW